MIKLPVYLDHNATTPCDPRVLDAMIPYFNSFYGNAASRSHSLGWQAEAAVDLAREQVAELIGADPKEIVFTSGATESDNLALKGIFEMYSAKGNHIITVVTEHNAVLDSCRHIEKWGGEISYLPVDPGGLIHLADLEAAIRPSTILISVMYANNELGLIQPIEQIGKMAKNAGILFFTDATQAVGKVPIDVQADHIDLMAFSAHKIYGPKGVGALYVRRKNPRVRITAQIDGGGHERGMRSGTLNVPGIVGFGKACEIARQEMAADNERTGRLRDQLEKALLGLEESQVNGNILHRLSQVSNISFKYVESEALILEINKHIGVSSGSACTSASLEPSHVLKAMGLSDDLARSSIRFGLGRFTTEEEIQYTIDELVKAVGRIRERSPFWEMRKTGQFQ